MNTNNFFEKQGQGAIEYLLLLAAAIIVVSIVITFMISTIGPVQDSGDSGTYGYICDTLKSQTFECGCYNGPGSTIPDVNSTNCCNNTDKEILQAKWNCPT